MLNNVINELKLRGAAEALPDLVNIDCPQLFATGLLQAEVNYRKSKSQIRRLSNAKFPAEKEWEGIDLKLNSNIPFSKIKSELNIKLVDNKENVCLIGTQGTGKTHSLIAFGRDCCRNGKTVKFYTACQLVNELEEAKSKLLLSRYMKQIQKYNLIIIDELGFIPFSKNGARLLFDVFSKRYEQGSIAISSNLSFAKWAEIFGSVEMTSALIDRFTHHCKIFTYKGESVRLRAAKSNQ